MITFHNESLVQPELCRLLSQSVPEELHVPLIFHARRIAEAERGVMGQTRWPDPRIHISLGMVWASPWSSSAGLWRELLALCYHEFGHVATHWAHDFVSWREYAKHRDSYRWVERQADEWAERRLAIVCDRDSRLGQPTRIRGYLGARLTQYMNRVAQCEVGSGKAAFVREWRFLKTGGQLTAGDMLRRLNCDPSMYSNAYRLLREASEGIGIDYTDGAMRHHKLYNWGDGASLAARFDLGRLRVSRQFQEEQNYYEEPEDGPPRASKERLEEWVQGVAGWEHDATLSGNCDHVGPSLPPDRMGCTPEEFGA